MAINPRSWQYASCDECGADGPEGYTSVEVRAKAYVEGWRFPPRVLKNGTKSPSRCRDICPACAAKGSH